MLLPRIIPCLLLTNEGLVKTENFKNPKYISDQINTVKIFNEKSRWINDHGYSCNYTIL